MTPGLQNRIRIAGAVAMACALLAGCEVSIKFPPISEAAEQRARSVKAKKIVARAVREGRCKDARAVALAVSDTQLAKEAEATCRPDPARTGFPTDPRAAQIDVLRDARPLAGNRHPDWRYRPSPEVIQFFYPEAAWKADLEGKVVVGCEVNTQGTPQDCKVISETPPEKGFGPAALKVARICEFLPAHSNGKAVTSTVRIPIAFKMPD